MGVWVGMGAGVTSTSPKFDLFSGKNKKKKGICYLLNLPREL